MMSDQVMYVQGSSRKVCQLTGEFDRERQQFTVNRTASRFGLAGTDLGFSFEHNRRLYFLFGDTNGAALPNAFRPPAGDSIAYTEDTDAEPCPVLHFLVAPDGFYLSPQTVPPISLGAFEVPVSGFSANGNMYVFFTTDHSDQYVMGRSVLTRLEDESRNLFRLIYDVSTLKSANPGHFLTIAPVVVNNADIPGLPETAGQGVLLWGSGDYRKSNPYLA